MGLVSIPDGRIAAPPIAGYLALALLMGGAGSYYPLIALVLELGALVLLAVAAPLLARRGTSALGWAALGLLAAWVLWGAVQLVPVSPDAWRSFGGREVATTVRDTVGLGQSWFPLSLAPDQGLRVLLSLLPPVAVLAAALAFPRAGRTLVLIVIAVALISAILGALQFAAGGGGFRLYEGRQSPVPTGLFVNRNHQASFLVVAIILAAGLARSRLPRLRSRALGLSALMATILVLSLGIVATASRFGVSMLLPALLLSVILLVPRIAGWRLWVLIGGGLVASGFLTSTPLFERVASRFDSVGDDIRYAYWDATNVGIAETLPWGSGIGSFRTFYPTLEPLDGVYDYTTNHAHNDILELVLEGGIPAIVLLGLFAVLLVLAAVRRLRTASPDERPLVIAALGGIAVLLAHSVPDYPLRMTGGAVLFALLCGLVIPARVRAEPQDEATSPATRRPLRLAGLGVLGIALVAAAIGSVRSGVGYSLVLNGEPEAATAWWPQSYQAWSMLADTRLRAGDNAGAQAAAMRAIEANPLDSVAMRTLGFALLAQGDAARGEAVLLAAGQIGWRDPATQMWMAQYALDAGDPTTAVLRLDAVLRQNWAPEQVRAAMLTVAADPRGREVLAQQLAVDPLWRRAFMTSFATAPADRWPAAEALLVRMRESGRPASRAEVEEFIGARAAAGDMAGALRTWRAVDDQPFPSDGGFDALSGPLWARQTPFLWSPVPLYGTQVAMGRPEVPWDGNAAIVADQGMATGPVLRQTIMLAPGSYRLETMLWPAEAARTALAWRLSCAGTAVPAADAPAPADMRPERGDWLATTQLVSVPADCAVQHLDLVFVNGSRPARSYAVDAVRVIPSR